MAKEKTVKILSNEERSSLKFIPDIFKDLQFTFMDKRCSELSEGDGEFREATEKLKVLLREYEQLNLDKESKAIIDNLITGYNDLSEQAKVLAYIAGQMDLYENLWQKELVMV